jgi:hypothetical protein
MFERLKRLWKSISNPPEDEPESVDHPRPKRANANPPQRDWFARVREKSLDADAARKTRALERLDDDEPQLSREASKQVDDLLTKAGAAPTKRR